VGGGVLKLPCEVVDVDLAKGEHKEPAFLSKNPFGQVPVLEDGDVRIADSNAILVYLALKYDAQRKWYPDNPVTVAKIQQWFSTAAGALANGPAAARVAKVFRVPLDAKHARVVAADLLAQMDRHLADRQYLVGSAPTIADLSLYAYTAHAPEGGVPLVPYKSVRAWIGRVEALDGFVSMKQFGG
jgi:glutathione S-transferase